MSDHSTVQTKSETLDCDFEEEMHWSSRTTSVRVRLAIGVQIAIQAATMTGPGEKRELVRFADRVKGEKKLTHCR